MNDSHLRNTASLWEREPRGVPRYICGNVGMCSWVSVRKCILDVVRSALLRTQRSLSILLTKRIKLSVSTTGCRSSLVIPVDLDTQILPVQITICTGRIQKRRKTLTGRRRKIRERMIEEWQNNKVRRLRAENCTTTSRKYRIDFGLIEELVG
ncbi:hypothetical protein EVAR_91934_1 [Eumeta japonica]|uniref:Uncharacterized protein n=1 Tax=Eumeta variegata TaxID=151549 RepID=A0A4C1STG6_EUMVA|nr:hypothetical protein EVAR_91934_1 [Eumeta japonica]